MTVRSSRNDPRIAETIKHLKILARRKGSGLVVNDYHAYRAQHAMHLPAMTTMYRLFGSWGEALAAAGADQCEKTTLSRLSDEDADAALQSVAKELKTKVLSSHAYDEYRKTKAPHLPSSSVIRKWAPDQRWAGAVRRAGLETTERAAPRKPAVAEIIEALRNAKHEIDGMLTPHTYTSLVAAYPETEREKWPTTEHILKQFPNWEAALRAADVEQSDALHPKALWTAEEVRRIAQNIEKYTGRPLDQAGYDEIHAKSKRKLPSWQVIVDLLSDRLP